MWGQRSGNEEEGERWVAPPVSLTSHALLPLVPFFLPLLTHKQGNLAFASCNNKSGHLSLRDSLLA